jgi:hypothetical protein
MLLAWIVHMKTHLLNDICDVREREGEILESPGKTLILSGSATGVLMEATSFGNVSTGVVAGLQAVMPTLSRISTAYLTCERCMSKESRVTVIPRKKLRLPMSVMANSGAGQREAVIQSRSRVEDAVRMISSTYSKRKAVPSAY